MAGSHNEDSTYFADTKAHNPWWEGDYTGLREVSEFPIRSDAYEIIKDLSRAYEADDGTQIFAIRGQTGIGKTTLLKQVVATAIDYSDVGVKSDESHKFLGAFHPTQVFYLPLEDSLYQLQRPEQALEQGRRVLEYFRNRIASPSDPALVLLDDIGAFGDDVQERVNILEELAETETYIIVAGSTRNDFLTGDGTPALPGQQRPTPMLPMKFIDFVKARAGSEVTTFVKQHQSANPSTTEEALISKARRDLSGAHSPPDPEAFATVLNELYFTAMDNSIRQSLNERSRQYLRRGGFPGAVTAFESTEARHKQGIDSMAVNDLLRSRLLLFLYKEVSDDYNIERPVKLHQLCSLAATSAQNEYAYNDLTDRLEVDRRTVQNYLDTLADVIVLTESHKYNLQRHRRTRLYVRDPRHAVLLSRRHEHDGFETLDGQYPLNPEFERQLALTAAFDHSLRLAFGTRFESAVEYAETETGLVEFILRYDDTVVPLTLGYEPRTAAPVETLTSFSPETGSHTDSDGNTLNLSYHAPIRFNICDSLPQSVTTEGSLMISSDSEKICHVPLWLYLLVC